MGVGGFDTDEAVGGFGGAIEHVWLALERFVCERQGRHPVPE